MLGFQPGKTRDMEKCSYDKIPRGFTAKNHHPKMKQLKVRKPTNKLLPNILLTSSPYGPPLPKFRCTKFERVLHRNWGAERGRNVLCKTSLPNAAATKSRQTSVGRGEVDLGSGLTVETVISQKNGDNKVHHLLQ